MHDIKKSNTFRSGFVAVMGRPNVGKSTLINPFLRQKVASVSPRPQTTRRNQLGILSLPQAQIIFIDTPGLHYARNKLGENMNQKAIKTLEETDLILFLVDASTSPTPEDRLLADMINSSNKDRMVIIALNKIDLVTQTDLSAYEAAFNELVPHAKSIPISATRGDNLDELISLIINHLPIGPAFYPKDQITDLNERQISADLIREAALLILRDEVPHGIAVRIDQFTERNQHGAYIEATIFVEKESHKGIVIGQGGEML